MTGLRWLDTWFPYCWETDELLYLPEDYTTKTHKRPLDGNVPLTCRSFPVRGVLFSVNQLLSMDEACTRIFCSDGSLGSASGAKGGDLRHHERTPNPNYHYGNEWNFADGPVDSHADVLASLP